MASAAEQQLPVGKPVFGLVHGCLGSVATADARMLASAPQHMSAEEAATLPTAFVTAEAVLNGVVRLQPGETVLIHAGTGGVGLAALQVGSLMGQSIMVWGAVLWVGKSIGHSKVTGGQPCGWEG
jgi:NADPH:quinone reductase-like Zn-dependent oxidoreductase